MATTIFPKPLDYDVSEKLPINQGVENAGKIMKVGEDGMLEPAEESGGTVTGVKMNNGSPIQPDANGVIDLGDIAELDQSGKVPASMLPSYVDDVLEYASLANFPTDGETGKIYVALDTDKTYRWSGSAYIEVGPMPDVATQSSDGLMSSTDKTKLDGITVMTGATSSAAGTSGLTPAPASTDIEKFLRGDGTWQEGGKPMVILSYGNSTWAEFLEAYNNNVIVYCRASSNANPATGTQGRMAFMAFVNNPTDPTSVEFQYYRSVGTKSSSQMGDQVFVYKLDKTAGWTVEIREASIKSIVAATGTKLSVVWANDTVTLTNTMTAADMDMSSSDSTKVDVAIGALNDKKTNQFHCTTLSVKIYTKSGRDNIAILVSQSHWGSSYNSLTYVKKTSDQAIYKEVLFGNDIYNISVGSGYLQLEDRSGYPGGVGYDIVDLANSIDRIESATASGSGAPNNSGLTDFLSVPALNSNLNKPICYDVNNDRTIESNRTTAMKYVLDNYFLTQKATNVVIRYAGGYYNAVIYAGPNNSNTAYQIIEIANNPWDIIYWSYSTSNGWSKGWSVYDNVTPRLLPTVSASDNGKVLRVVNGAWAVDSLPSANGVSF